MAMRRGDLTRFQDWQSRLIRKDVDGVREQWELMFSMLETTLMGMNKETTFMAFDEYMRMKENAAAGIPLLEGDPEDDQPADTEDDQAADTTN